MSKLVCKPSEIRKRKINDIIARIIIWGASIFTISVLVWILGYILIKGLPHVNLEFLTSAYRGEKEGILYFIINTLYIVLLTVVISTPIGIFTAIYLVEYSKQGRTVKMIRFAVETLAGIPSIIYGLFGLIFFVTICRLSHSLLAGAFTLSIMVLPTIIRTTEEALKSVPDSFREGSLALGATKLLTTLKVVLPCAIPGILTAVILSIGRIVGETAALIYTSGINTNLAQNVTSGGRTLSLHLYLLANEGISFDKAFATAAILLIIVFLINIISNKTASKLKRLTMGK